MIRPPDLTLGGRIAAPSIQSLFLRFKFEDTVLASGTGFLVQTEVGFGLVTARHNFTGLDQHSGRCLHKMGGIPDSIEIFHNGLTPLSNILKTERLFAVDHTARWIEHSKLGDKCDVVLLPLADLENVYVAPYLEDRQYPEIAVKVTEQVSVVGFPMSQSGGGMLAIWCSGYVASEPSQDYAGQPQFLIDCRTRKGQSGAPVIAYRNGPFSSESGGLAFGAGPACRPLGVYTGRIHPEADIGVVWKWSVVEDLKHQMVLNVAKAVQDTIIEFGSDSAEFAAELKKFNLSNVSHEPTGLR